MARFCALAVIGLASLGVSVRVTAEEAPNTRVYHLDRGYERVEEKLAACGADIERRRGGRD